MEAERYSGMNPNTLGA